LTELFGLIIEYSFAIGFGRGLLFRKFHLLFNQANKTIGAIMKRIKLLPPENIEAKILIIRGQRVILD
jgi:hypothetical protein